nr:hypothetical protein [Tanacetum cinerariifolium]
LDKQIHLEKRIKELNNIVLKTGQSIQTIHMLLPKPNSFYHTKQKMALGYQNPFYLKKAQKKQQSLYDGKVLLEKHDPPVVHDSEETLQLAQESRDKMKQMNKEIKPANYTKINHLSGVFVLQKALSREESYFSNNSKTANVSKSSLIPNEDRSDDTTPSVARKFLNEVKSTILTLQRVVKQRMTIETHNWASSAHQELHKIKVPNTVSASSRTKPITISQSNVITKKNVNFNLNGLSSTRLDNTKTRRPQPRSNTKNDRVPSASKSSRSKNKEAKVEEYHRNLLLSTKNKHISSACNNSKIDSQDVISKVVCVVCKKCLNYVNHDVCLNNYVNGKKSRGRKHKANVSKKETQQKKQPKIKKPKKVGFIKRLATPKPRKPTFLLRWSPTGKMFDQDGKLVVPSNSESHVDCSNGLPKFKYHKEHL